MAEFAARQRGGTCGASAKPEGIPSLSPRLPRSGYLGSLAFFTRTLKAFHRSRCPQHKAKPRTITPRRPTALHWASEAYEVFRPEYKTVQRGALVSRLCV